MGLIVLNFHIETFEGNKCCNFNFLDIANIDSDPFKSIVSIANKSKSNLSIDALDIDLFMLIEEMIAKF